MATTYTNTTVDDLIINKLTKQEYEAIQNPSSTELYLVPEEVDSVVTQNSDNPVQSGAVYDAIKDAKDVIMVRFINNVPYITEITSLTSMESDGSGGWVEPGTSTAISFNDGDYYIDVDTNNIYTLDEDNELANVTSSVVITPNEDSIYVDVGTDQAYRWNGTAYVAITSTIPTISTNTSGSTTYTSIQGDTYVVNGDLNVAGGDVTCIPTGGSQVSLSELSSSKQNTLQYATLPTASSSNVGKIYQYIGADNANYTKGQFYISTLDTTNNTYSWVPIGIGDANVPVGTITPYAGSSAPNGNWKICDGSAISRTTYADLFSVIGTTYGVGDGSTTFNLPDLREVVPVGAGTSTRSGITAHDSYNLGQFKDDQMQDHNHLMSIGWGDDGGLGSNYLRAPANDPTYATNSQYIVYGRKGATTHGKQLGVNYIIRVFRSAEEVATPVNYNNIPIEFSQASSHSNISSGETLATMFGKLREWYSNLMFKSNYNYVSTNDTITLTMQSSLIPYYTSALFAITSHGNCYGIALMRVSHGDSWYSRITNIDDNVHLNTGSTTVSSGVVTVTLSVDISGSNKYSFHALSGVPILSISVS